jgi:hypothetical protein
MGRRTNHLRATRLFESPAVAQFTRPGRRDDRGGHPLRQRFRFRTANVGIASWKNLTCASSAIAPERESQIQASTNLVSFS